MTQRQFGKFVKIIRSDNGTEFESRAMQSFYTSAGILHQTSLVDTAQYNGLVARKHRHILEVARALRFQANLPLELWGECVLTATHLINCTPSYVLNTKTPHEILFFASPAYNHLRFFGCLCYAVANPQESNKFAPRSRRCVFLGYPYDKKGWKVLDLETFTVFISRNILFEETVFPFAHIHSDKESGLQSSSPSPLPSATQWDWHYSSLVSPTKGAPASTASPPSLSESHSLDPLQSMFPGQIWAMVRESSVHQSHFRILSVTWLTFWHPADAIPQTPGTH